MFTKPQEATGKRSRDTNKETKKFEVRIQPPNDQGCNMSGISKIHKSGQKQKIMYFKHWFEYLHFSYCQCHNQMLPLVGIPHSYEHAAVVERYKINLFKVNVTEICSLQK